MGTGIESDCAVLGDALTGSPRWLEGVDSKGRIVLPGRLDGGKEFSRDKGVNGFGIGAGREKVVTSPVLPEANGFSVVAADGSPLTGDGTDRLCMRCGISTGGLGDPETVAIRGGRKLAAWVAGCAATASPDTRAMLLATGAEAVKIVGETTVAPGF